MAVVWKHKRTGKLILVFDEDSDRDMLDQRAAAVERFSRCEDLAVEKVMSKEELEKKKDQVVDVLDQEAIEELLYGRVRA